MLASSLPFKNSDSLNPTFVIFFVGRPLCFYSYYEHNDFSTLRIPLVRRTPPPGQIELLIDMGPLCIDRYSEPAHSELALLSVK